MTCCFGGLSFCELAERLFCCAQNRYDAGIKCKTKDLGENMFRLWIALSLVVQGAAYSQTFQEHCENAQNLPPAQQAFIKVVLDDYHAECDTVQGAISKHGSLTLNNRKLTDISLISSIKGIKQLEMRRNRIADINALAALDSLETLDISYNVVADLTPLAQLAKLGKLIELNLEMNMVTDVAPLQSITSLKKLNLHDNAISDFSPLKPLVHLTHVGVGHSPWQKLSRCKQHKKSYDHNTAATAKSLEDIVAGFTQLEEFKANGIDFKKTTGFEKLAKLRTLAIDCASIEETNVLATMWSIDSLSLKYNRLKTIAPPPNLRPFISLDLEGNFLTDSSFLDIFTEIRGLNLADNALSGEFTMNSQPELRRLYLGGNDLKYVDLKGDFSKLKFFNISHNRITYVHFDNSEGSLVFFDASDNLLTEPYAGINFSGNLFGLDISNNQVRDFSFINDIKITKRPQRGFTLNVGGNPSSDFSAITHPKIDKFVATGSHLINANSLPRLPKLSRLDLGDNNLKSLDGLAEMYPNLYALMINNNPLSDGSELKAFEKLSYLDLSGTKLRSYHVLSQLPKLSGLSLRRQSIADTSFLSGIKELRDLDLSHNNISDLSQLVKAAPALDVLKLAGNLVRDVTPLAQYSGLDDSYDLELRDNPLGTTIPKTAENCPTASASAALIRWCKSP